MQTGMLALRLWCVCSQAPGEAGQVRGWIFKVQFGRSACSCWCGPGSSAVSLSLRFRWLSPFCKARLSSEPHPIPPPCPTTS